jgi:hypothetical protein
MNYVKGAGVKPNGALCSWLKQREILLNRFQTEANCDFFPWGLLLFHPLRPAFLC